MRIWLRIFLLTISLALTSLLISGTLQIRAGYRTQLDAEVRGLMRATDLAALVATNSLRTALYLSGRSISSVGSAETVTNLLKQIQGQIAGAGTGVEIYTSDLQVVFSGGHVALPPSMSESPELAEAAAGRASYILRRTGTDLYLYLATSERIFQEPFIFRTSIHLVALDEYGRAQLVLLAVSAAAAMLLMSAAAFMGSRAIAGRLEHLARQAAALARGDYHGRASVRGKDEVSALAREFNSMADGVEAAVSRLRSEKADRQSFIDDLTHELRTPITSIVGFADQLSRIAYDEAVFVEGLGRIRDEGRRMLSISESLTRLLLSRTKSKVLSEEKIDDLLRQAATTARERAADHRIELHVPEHAGALAVDRDLLLAALGNLLDNAVRASAPGSTIVLGFGTDDSARWLFVRDAGGAHGERKAGLGLGKSICREIADFHGARLEYKGEADGGTSAKIVFPI